MAKVSPKVRKASMYKMISYKGVTGVQSKYTPITAAARLPKVEKSVGRGLQSIVSGLNSLGSTLNSIAANTQNSLTSWRDNIRTQIKSADKIAKQEALTDRKDRKRKAFKDKQTKKRRLFQLRNSKEEKAEKKKGKKAGFGESAINAAKKAGGGIFAAIFNLFGALGDLIKFKIFEWISQNPKTVARLGMILGGIGKFILNVYSFLGGMALDGLVDFLENPISLKGFFGAIKLITGITPIFASLLFLKNPKLVLEGAKKVIGGLVGGLRRLFGFQSKEQKFRDFKLKKLKGGRGNWFGTRTGKIATGLGAGAAGFLAAKGEGASNVEAVGAGGGAAAGQALGAKIGGKLGGAPGAAVGSIVGGLAGGKVGKAIGGLIKPITEPVGRFFKMIGDTFNNVIKDIKEPLEEFFTTLGAFLSGILEAVEPHMPIISKIISTGFKVLFWPLFLGMKALTAVLKLFTGGKSGDGGGGGGDDEKTESSSYSTSMSYKRKGNVETGLMEVVPGTQPEGVSIEAANQHNYQQQIRKLEQEKRFDKIKTEAQGLEFDPTHYDTKLLKLEKAYNNTLEFGGITTSAKIGREEKEDIPKKAKGGWINGPQSGYPVSLNGGRSTAFIGHGLEWVGQKKAAGGAFVIPYNTPATKRDRGLTARRVAQAKRGGYHTPSFAAGGEVKKPQGVWRWLAGAADHMTMGLTDFDKRGSTWDGAMRLKDNIGQKLEDAKQKDMQRRYEKLKAALQDSASTQIINQEAPMQAGGADMSEEVPIFIPGDDDHDADKYIYPKFGIINEFMTDPVEFM